VFGEGDSNYNNSNLTIMELALLARFGVIRFMKIKVHSTIESIITM